MKVISLLIVTILSRVTATVSTVWLVVEFILHLVKDKEFNWWSIWVFVLSLMVAISTLIFSSLMEVRSKNKAREVLRNGNAKPGRFQKRLEEMKKLQEEKRFKNK